jgi:capsular polysaccharide export protein
MNFVCLGLSGAKVELLRPLLEPLGHVEQWSFVPPGWQRYPEAATVAERCWLRAIRNRASRGTSLIARHLYELQYSFSRRFFERHSDCVAVCWNGLNGSRAAFMAGARDAGVKRLFAEEAPLPSRLSLDHSGINFENSLPRVAAPYLAWYQDVGRRGRDWRLAFDRLVQRPPRRSDYREQVGRVNRDAPFLFVPLQVPNDSQLRVFGGAFKRVEEFVAALAVASERLPQGWYLRIKDHPSAATSVAEQVRRIGSPRIVLDNLTDTFELVSASQAVVTVNSSVGLQSFLFDKPVLACGECFWAIDGVTQSARTLDALRQHFADPALLSFDPKLRDAFMAYLDQRYYVSSDPGSVGVSVRQVSERLTGGPLF